MLLWKNAINAKHHKSIMWNPNNAKTYICSSSNTQATQCAVKKVYDSRTRAEASVQLSSVFEGSEGVQESCSVYSLFEE